MRQIFNPKGSKYLNHFGLQTPQGNITHCSTSICLKQFQIPPSQTPFKKSKYSISREKVVRLLTFSDIKEERIHTNSGREKADKSLNVSSTFFLLS